MEVQLAPVNAGQAEGGEELALESGAEFGEVVSKDGEVLVGVGDVQAAGVEEACDVAAVEEDVVEREVAVGDDAAGVRGHKGG